MATHTLTDTHFSNINKKKRKRIRIKFFFFLIVAIICTERVRRFWIKPIIAARNLTSLLFGIYLKTC
jgi:hypothetical protein